MSVEFASDLVILNLVEGDPDPYNPTDIVLEQMDVPNDDLHRLDIVSEPADTCKIERQTLDAGPMTHESVTVTTERGCRLLSVGVALGAEVRLYISTTGDLDIRGAKGRPMRIAGYSLIEATHLRLGYVEAPQGVATYSQTLEAGDGVDPQQITRRKRGSSAANAIISSVPPPGDDSAVHIVTPERSV